MINYTYILSMISLVRDNSFKLEYPDLHAYITEILNKNELDRTLEYMNKNKR